VAHDRDCSVWIEDGFDNIAVIRDIFHQLVIIERE